jgi:cell division transport system permease protein
MKKKHLGAGASVSLLVTLSLALFNLGLFGLILLSGSEVDRMIRESFTVSVVMLKEAGQTERQALQVWLSGRPYTARKEGKPQIQFVSKEEAARTFIQNTGEDFMAFLGENPLRDGFQVRIGGDWLERGRLRKIREEILRQPGVFEVNYVEVLAENIEGNLKKLSYLVLGIGALFFLTSVWLLRNTIRLAVYSQRFLIRTMELVGAEPGFIRRPYVLSMLTRGAIAGLLAVVLLLFGLQAGQTYFPEVRLYLVPEKVAVVMLILPVFGALAGAVSAWQAVASFQGRRLDDLHRYG